MSKLIALPVLALVALAGCQQGGESQTPAANATEAAQPADEGAEANVAGNADAGENVTARVLAMGDRERNVVFIRAILDAGLKCDGVTASQRLEDRNGQPVWRAECGPGNAHVISITPDGTANIISRNDR